MSKPIYVTQPDLPPLDDFIPMLEQIWDSKILTNGGSFQQWLEDALCEYPDVLFKQFNKAYAQQTGSLKPRDLELKAFSDRINAVI